MIREAGGEDLQAQVFDDPAVLAGEETLQSDAIWPTKQAQKKSKGA